MMKASILPKLLAIVIVTGIAHTVVTQAPQQTTAQLQKQIADKMEAVGTLDPAQELVKVKNLVQEVSALHTKLISATKAGSPAQAEAEKSAASVNMFLSMLTLVDELRQKQTTDEGKQLMLDLISVTEAHDADFLAYCTKVAELPDGALLLSTYILPLMKRMLEFNKKVGEEYAQLEKNVQLLTAWLKNPAQAHAMIIKPQPYKVSE